MLAQLQSLLHYVRWCLKEVVCKGAHASDCERLNHVEAFVLEIHLIFQKLVNGELPRVGGNATRGGYISAFPEP